MVPYFVSKGPCHAFEPAPNFAGHYSVVFCFLVAFTRNIRRLSHEVGVLKPDARIFNTALERAGVEAERALFVDDQAANVAGARELGIDSFNYLLRNSRPVAVAS